jgi:rhamnosyltransferase
LEFTPELENIVPNPKVAVLLATYNGEQWLTEQLDSILQSEGVETHVFASDDGSTDGTLAILRSMPASSLTLLPSARTGGAGQNFFRLIHEANFNSFDYIAFSDQDDVWLPQKLERAIFSISSQSLDAYSSDVTAFWADGRRRYIRKSQPQKELDFMFEGGGPGNTFVLPLKSALILRNFLQSVPVDDLRRVNMHDWFIYAFFRSQGYLWKIDSYSGVLYRQHSANVIGAGQGFKALIRRIKLLRADWYRQQIVLFGDLLNIENSTVNFLKDFSWSGLPKSVLGVRRYRRKFKDQLALAAYFVCLAVFKSKV